MYNIYMLEWDKDRMSFNGMNDIRYTEIEYTLLGYSEKGYMRLGYSEREYS